MKFNDEITFGFMLKEIFLSLINQQVVLSALLLCVLVCGVKNCKQQQLRTKIKAKIDFASQMHLIEILQKIFV